MAGERAQEHLGGGSDGKYYLLILGGLRQACLHIPFL